MSIKNSATQYGLPSIVLHWFMAVALIAMYFVGDYMVELDYYDTYYHTLPHWHKSAGILLAAVWFLRLIWNYSHRRPNPPGANTPKLQKIIVIVAHMLLYALVAALIVSGYLISTAKGAGIDVFDFFKVPALLPSDADRGETAGYLHELFGNIFMGLVAVHAIAALYHHFVLKDRALKRMLGIKGKN